MKFIYLNLFLLVIIPGTLAQQMTDSTFQELKNNFIGTFQDDFTFIDDTVTYDKEGVGYWLVTVSPKRKGFYIIRYTCQNHPGHGHLNSSYEYQLSVGEKHEKRFVDYHNSRNLKQACYDMRVDDFVTIPVKISKWSLNYAFFRESQHGPDHNFDKESLEYYTNLIETDLFSCEVKNNIDELVFVGIQTSKIAHRNPGASTIKYRTVFRAVKPGKFNLKINGHQSIPVTILDKEESLHTITGHVAVREWDGPASSTSSAVTFILENPTLRVDDILIVTLTDTTPADECKIKIVKSSFSRLKQGYDDWIQK